MAYWKGEIMPEAITSGKLREMVMYDTKFQAACQRYAHSGGSSEAIAAAAVEVIIAATKEAP